MSKAGFEMDLKPHWPLFKFQKDFTVKGKVKFACKVFRTEDAQILGYPLVKKLLGSSY